MEGKSALFKTFGGLDSIPIVLDTKDPDEIVETLIRLRPTFGAVNLEDISAPRCFEIERRVIEALDCPVMHDDQHGTAIVVLAALLGATKVLDRDIALAARSSSPVPAPPASPAPTSCSTAGSPTSSCWTARASCRPAATTSTPFKAELAQRTNPRGLTGGIAEALDGADVFLGVSAGLVPEELIATMAPERHRLRDVQPRSGDPPRRRPQVRGRGGHRPQRLPQPDQQRAGLPRRVPRARSTRAPAASPRR